MVQNLAILGSTGSIGTQTLQVVAQFQDRLKVCALAAGSNIDLLEQQVRRFQPEVVAVYDQRRAAELRKSIADLPVTVVAGRPGLEEAAARPEVDTAIIAMVGFNGVFPTLAAIKAGKKLALANKETLVVAGELVMAEARRHNAVILPIDSEHAAVFQCLQAGNTAEVRRIILTASGGPFWGRRREELARATPGEALNHPNWKMGPRISIDSATLMNKGLEVIEACRLFALSPDQIEVVIHPESIVHSMVEFVDGAVMAQLGPPDMQLPILYALSHPHRWPAPFPRLDWRQMHTLHFYPVKAGDYPCLDLAYQALRAGGTMPAVLNGADEIAVKNFINGRIGFLEIPALLADITGRHVAQPDPALGEIVGADLWARAETEKLIKRGGASRGPTD